MCVGGGGGGVNAQLHAHSESERVALSNLWCSTLGTCAQVRLRIATSTTSTRVELLTVAHVNVDLAFDLPSKCVPQTRVCWPTLVHAAGAPMD